jgi:translation initiation factor 3 subunit C
MSRFWAGANSSDSDSSSGSDSAYSSDEDKNAGGANRWVDFSDSDSEDDEVRVVKSGKERALDIFGTHIANIRAAMKSRDYYQIQTEFDELAKAMIKAKKVLAEGVPRSLVKILVDLEDYIPERLADRAAFRKLSARQGRALNRMKLTLKKHNKPYQVVMDHYRKNPDNEDDNDGNDPDGDALDDSSDDDSSSSSSSSSNSSKSSKSSDSSKSSASSAKKTKNKAKKGSVRDSKACFFLQKSMVCMCRRGVLGLGVACMVFVFRLSPITRIANDSQEPNSSFPIAFYISSFKISLSK